MVTFANLGSFRLPSLKFVGLRVRKIRRIYCVSCLSTTVSWMLPPGRLVCATLLVTASEVQRTPCTTVG